MKKTASGSEKIYIVGASVQHTYSKIDNCAKKSCHHRDTNPIATFYASERPDVYL
jgi:hypothetical protein